MKDVGKLIEKKMQMEGLSKAALGKRLGTYSGQLIGQYVSGRHKPKADFYEAWKKAFGEDLYETNVSHETSDNQPINKMNDPEEVYKNIVEGNTEYILIPRTVLQEKYRLVAIEQIQKDQAFLQGQFETITRLLNQLDKLNAQSLEVQKAKQ